MAPAVKESAIRIATAKRLKFLLMGQGYPFLLRLMVSATMTAHCRMASSKYLGLTLNTGPDQDILDVTTWASLKTAISLFNILTSKCPGISSRIMVKASKGARARA